MVSILHNDVQFVFSQKQKEIEMPLRELMRGFFDRVKNASSGYASLSYEFLEERPADVVRLDILVADEAVPAFARVIHTHTQTTHPAQHI